MKDAGWFILFVLIMSAIIMSWGSIMGARYDLLYKAHVIETMRDYVKEECLR